MITAALLAVGFGLSIAMGALAHPAIYSAIIGGNRESLDFDKRH